MRIAKSAKSAVMIGAAFGALAGCASYSKNMREEIAAEPIAVAPVKLSDGKVIGRATARAIRAGSAWDAP